MQKVKPLTQLPKLLKKTETYVNTYIRERDAGQPCISCGSDKANQAGHYFAVKKASFLRYHPININLQCAHCNCFLHGNESFYRIGLVAKWGEDRVRELERLATDPRYRLYKWSRFELEQIINECKNGTFGLDAQP